MTEHLAGVDVSRETVAALGHFADLTVKWTRKINLIAPNTIDSIWERHVLDSLQLYQFAPESFAHWVDLGSGAGFPGIVMAIAAQDKQPEARFTLIESDQRKAAFLRTAARELSLPVKVLATRIEDAPPQRADVVSARALAPLSTLLGQVAQHLAPTGTALLPKGRQASAEIADAQNHWRFALEDQASFTDPEARILVIQRIESLAN